MSEPKRTKKKREQRKLSRTVNTLASIIDTIATSMKGDIEKGEEWDIKQLKELTGAAKELSSLISSLNTGETDGEDRGVFVHFSEGCEKWAE